MIRILTIICLLRVICGYSQSTFSYLLSTLDDERIFHSAEDNLGNCYFVGRKAIPNTNDRASYLLVLDNSGEMVYESEFSLEDSVSYFGCVFSRNDSIFIFGAKGPADSLCNNLWYLVLNTEFNVLLDKSFYLHGYDLVDINTIENSVQNFVVTGVVTLPGSQDPNMMFMEISPEGDSLHFSIPDLSGGQFTYDLIEDINEGYKVFCYGNFPGSLTTRGKIVYIDHTLNYTGVDSIPYGLYYNHAAKWLNENEYLITGNKRFHNPTNVNIGVVKMTPSDTLITTGSFGKEADTMDLVGAISNLDFIDPNSIYFGGTANIIPGYLFYQPDPSWLILTNLDSNLNLNWEKYYGGDAFYYLWGLQATSDGGCLLLSTRYDYLVQDYELDVFILKVDTNGSLTSVNDIPIIAANELYIFPNPASNQVNIQFPGVSHARQKELIIYNGLGSIVWHVKIPDHQNLMSLNVSTLPNGLYHAVIASHDQSIANGKILISR